MAHEPARRAPQRRAGIVRESERSPRVAQAIVRPGSRARALAEAIVRARCGWGRPRALGGSPAPRTCEDGAGREAVARQVPQGASPAQRLQLRRGDAEVQGFACVGAQVQGLPRRIVSQPHHLPIRLQSALGTWMLMTPSCPRRACLPPLPCISSAWPRLRSRRTHRHFPWLGLPPLQPGPPRHQSSLNAAAVTTGMRRVADLAALWNRDKWHGRFAERTPGRQHRQMPLHALVRTRLRQSCVRTPRTAHEAPKAPSWPCTCHVAVARTMRRSGGRSGCCRCSARPYPVTDETSALDFGVPQTHLSVVGRVPGCWHERMIGSYVDACVCVSHAPKRRGPLK